MQFYNSSYGWRNICRFSLKGKSLDVTNGLDGEDPFSPERSGGLPVGDLIKLCFNKKYSEYEIKKKIKCRGGLVAYLHTNDIREIEKNT